MKYLALLFFAFNVFCAQAQFNEAFTGTIEKNGSDYYFHEKYYRENKPARILVFTEIDSTGLADTLGLKWSTERDVRIYGKKSDKTVYRRGLPFKTINVTGIYGANHRYNWIDNLENTAPQQDTIFEVFCSRPFTYYFNELKNGKLMPQEGISGGKVDSVIEDYISKYRLFGYFKRGIYFKVKAKRWYGSEHMSGLDASFDYIMKVDKIIEADTTRSLWGYYANEIEQGRPAIFLNDTITQFPDDFKLKKTYKYKAIEGDYAIFLKLEKTSGGTINYTLTYSKAGTDKYVFKGTLLLDFGSYRAERVPENYEPVREYESEPYNKDQFHIELDPKAKDITKLIYLEFDSYYYEHPFYSCTFTRVD